MLRERQIVTGTQAVTANLINKLIVGVPKLLLIDPLSGEPLPGLTFPLNASLSSLNELRNEVWQRDSFVVELDPRIKLPLSLHPYVVALNENDDAWLAQSVEVARDESLVAQAGGLEGTGMAAYRMGSWLQSALTLDKLCQSLSTLMNLKAEVVTKARYLRLADRRVMGLLHHVIGHARISRALQDIQQWCYLDHAGDVATVKAGNEFAPLTLTADELSTMADGELIHRAASCWRGECAQSLPDAELYPQIKSALEFAKQAAIQWPARFVTQDDYVAFATLELLFPGLRTRPIVSRRLAVDAHASAAQGLPDTFHSLSRDLHTALTELKPS
jgi:hypothetical protein